MPTYTYRCAACDNEFEKRHSMSETLESCILCGDQGIVRVPSLSFTVSRPTGAGGLVKEFIEETREEVMREKRRLKKEYDV